VEARDHRFPEKNLLGSRSARGLENVIKSPDARRVGKTPSGASPVDPHLLLGAKIVREASEVRHDDWDVRELGGHHVEDVELSRRHRYKMGN
jgi:hypothetical protein